MKSLCWKRTWLTETAKLWWSSYEDLELMRLSQVSDVDFKIIFMFDVNKDVKEVRGRFSNVSLLNSVT